MLLKILLGIYLSMITEERNDFPFYSDKCFFNIRRGVYFVLNSCCYKQQQERKIAVRRIFFPYYYEKHSLVELKPALGKTSITFRVFLTLLFEDILYYSGHLLLFIRSIKVIFLLEVCITYYIHNKMQEGKGKTKL